MDDTTLDFYAVYNDDEGGYFVQRWDVGDVPTKYIPREIVGRGRTLAEARAAIPPWTGRLPRYRCDDPDVVEVWL